MSKRIVWSGPWNALSWVAEFGSYVVEELVARGAAVDVLRTEVGTAATLPSLSAPGPVRFWGDVSIHQLRRNVDAVIANFGDQYSLHGGLLNNYASVGPIGIFHDHVLVHLAADWADTSPDPHAMLRHMVNASYGPAAWSQAEPFLTDRETVAQKRPMLEWFSSGLSGAVVHSSRHLQAARKACPGPVEFIPIAGQFSGFPPPRPPGDSLVVATVRMGTSDQRLDQIVQGIASSARLRARCRFRIIGQIDPARQRHLAHLATSLGMSPPELTGSISGETLLEKLRDVDVLACLRDPNEHAPAPMLFALQSGRPLLASSDDCFDLPAGLALPCMPGSEGSDVARHLGWVLDNSSAAHSMGKHAQTYSRSTHTAKRYVDALLPLLDAAVARRPTVLTGQALGRTLATIGVKPDDPAVGRVGKVLSELVGS